MTQPRPNPLLRVQFFPGAFRIVCTFRFPIFSGPTTELLEWMVRTTLGLTNPTAISIVGNALRLTNPLWDPASDPDLIDYTRGPIPYVSPDGQEVQSFQVPIPFP